MSTEQPTPEYKALDFDGTERRANYRTVAYREDVLHVLEHKDAAAIIYEIIYWWQTSVRKREVIKEIERRKKSGAAPLTEEEVEDMMWAWISYNEFVRESGGAIGYNTVIRTIDYLVNTAKVVEKRENHDSRFADYEYRINKEAIKKKLKALPVSPAFAPKVPKKKSNKGGDSTQMGTPENDSTQTGIHAPSSTQMGTESTQEGIATTHLGTEVYPNGGTSHNYSHNYTSSSSHEEGTQGQQQEQPCADAQPVPASHAQSTLENTPYRPSQASHSHNGTEDTNEFDRIGNHHRCSAGGSAGAQGAERVTEDTHGSSIDMAGHHRTTDHVASADSYSQASEPAHHTTGKPASQQPTTGVTGGGSGYKTPAEQSTLIGASQQDSAHVEREVDIKKLSLQAHTDYVFRWLDEIKKEAKKDQRASYVKSKTSESKIKDLITSCWNTDKELTRENVRKAWRQMWNSKPGSDGFSWKKAGITIDAYCRNYGEYLEKAWDEEAQKQQQATPSAPVLIPTASTPTVSGLPRWVPPSAAAFA